MIELSINQARILSSMNEFAGKVGQAVSAVEISKHEVLKDCNFLITKGLLDEDGLATDFGLDWLKKNAVPVIKKNIQPPKKLEPSPEPKDTNQANGSRSVNLRCPKCKFFAKTSVEMMERGRLKCPVDGTVLATKEERGEKKGRY